MDKKIKLLIGGLACAMSLSLLASCDQKKENSKLEYVNYKNMDTSPTNYNGDLFYRNDLLTLAPDPSVISADDGFGHKVYYMYATSPEIACTGVQVWKSYNLNTWNCIGVAFEPEENSWMHRDIWAPEVLPYQGKYYMCFSGRDNNDSYNRLSLNLAISDYPEGPFKQWSGVNADGRVVGLGDVWCSNQLFDESLSVYGKEMIDADLFVDDDGQIYLYFCSTNDSEGSCIWGMRMKDMFTPDYDSAVKLIRCRRKNVDDMAPNLTAVDENRTNEGPFMIKHNGKYYLTFSVNGFTSKNYGVKQAIGNSPLGKFTKVDLDKGGRILSAIENNGSRNYVNESGEEIVIDDYDQMSGTGHHCFITLDDQVYCLYHAHFDRVYGSDGDRAICIDKVKYAVNDDGEEVMYINGPTWSLQPLPEAVSGYKNIAPLAEVLATNMRSGSSKAYLNDDLIKMHNDSVAKDFVAKKTTEVTLTFPKYYNVTAVSVYNSFYYDKLWDKIDYIEFFTDKSKVGQSTIVVKNIEFDRKWGVDDDFQFVRAGSAAVVEFNEIPVNKIKFRINSKKPIAIGDVCILGRDLEKHVGDYQLEGHQINPVTVYSKSWRDIPVNEGIVLDGSLDEAIYQSQNWLEFDGNLTNTLHLGMTTVFGERGMYFAARVKDPFVSYNPDRAVYQNSSVEFMFCPSTEKKVNYNVLQLRVASNGTIDQYRGIYTGHGLVNDSYRWTQTYYSAMARTKGLGFNLTHLQPSIDETNVEGYSIEAYVPYSAIGLNAKPDRIRCIPSFNTLPSYTSTNRTSNLPFGLPYDAVGTYPFFDDHGYVLPGSGNTLGSMGKRISTPGVDLTNDTTDTKDAKFNNSDQQYTFFKDIESDCFYVETEVTANEIFQGDSFPKFGIIAHREEQTLYFCVECPNLNPDRGTMCFTGSLGSSNWNWGEIGTYSFDNVRTGRYTGNNKVKLGMARKGGNFYFFVNGEYTGKRENVPKLGSGVNTYVGFLTMNVGCDFKNYSINLDSSYVNNLIQNSTSDGEYLGSSVLGQAATTGFSGSNDRGDHPSTLQTGSEQRFTYFKDFKGTRYVVETKINVKSILNNDPTPKIGLIAASTATTSTCLMIEPSNLAPNKNPCLVNGVLGTGDWDWEGMIWYNNAQTGSYIGDSYVTLSVVRDNTKFYIFLDDNYVATYTNNSWNNVESTAGLITMNISASFFDYFVSDNESVIGTYLAKVS